MTEFTFNTAFRRELRENPLPYGEVIFLESVLRPGMTVIEVGANRGVTAIAIAKAVGEKGYVDAFEPVPEYYECLQENVSRNRIENISIYNQALSNENGSVLFYKHGEGSGLTRVEEAETIRVQATTLIQFVGARHIAKIDFINLDCEGCELLVLREAQTLLKKQAPAIFCEIHRDYLKSLNQSVKELVRFLRSLGYTVKPIQVEDLNRNTDFDKCSHIYASINGRRAKACETKRKENT